jgi:hypothetical protein
MGTNLKFPAAVAPIAMNIKPEAKIIFARSPCSYFAFYKTLTKVSHVQRLHITQHFRAVE